MRKRLGLLFGGTVGAALMLGLAGQRGWGQPEQQPTLRPGTLPPRDYAVPNKPIPAETHLPQPVLKLPPATAPAPDGNEWQPLNALPLAPPEFRLPPPPTSPGPEIIATPNRSRGAAVDNTVPPRFDAAPLQAPVSESLPAAKQEPSVSVEWIGPANAQLNRPMNCQILVRNTGPAPVHQVAVRHRLTNGVTCKQSEPIAAAEHGELVWNVGTLLPGQQRRIDLQLVASQRGAVNCQAQVTFAASAGQQVQVRQPQLLVKLRAPEQTVVGETVNLLFTVANPGDGVAELVKVKALLPDGLESTRGRSVEMDIGNLAPNENRTLQISCLAKSSGAHKAIVTANADGNLSASAAAVTDVLQAKLDLVVSGPKLRYLDRHAVYQIKVTNPGSAPAQNVTLNEAVPAGFKFHSATGGGRWEEHAKSVSWQLGDLMPGQTREVSIDLLAAATGDHRLLAQVASSRGVRTEASAVTRVEGSSALVIELSDVDDPVEVGGETAYEIRVTNAGTKTETNLELSCTLPEQVQFKGAKSIAGVRHRIEGREVTFDPLPRLAPKADVIYRITVRGLQAGDVRFRTRIRADGMPEPVLREESTRFYNDNILPK